MIFFGEPPITHFQIPNNVYEVLLDQKGDDRHEFVFLDVAKQKECAGICADVFDSDNQNNKRVSSFKQKCRKKQPEAYRVGSSVA